MIYANFGGEIWNFRAKEAEYPHTDVRSIDATDGRKNAGEEGNRHQMPVKGRKKGEAVPHPK